MQFRTSTGVPKRKFMELIHRDRKEPQAHSTYRIAILMGTYNGLMFLPAQLRSVQEQTYSQWRLWVSDDGSTDGTLDLLYATQESWGTDRLRIIHGPASGFVKNFLSLVCCKELSSDYYAYADQDDVWLPDKLAMAVSVLTKIDPSVPALYCGRTQLIDSIDKHIGYSKYARVKPSFHNAVLQNIASGNTMVFNDAARRLLVQAGSMINIYAHDWWTYLAIMAVNGIVHYDPLPMVQYRQHSGNKIGANDSFAAMFKRVKRDLRGDLRKIVEQHADALRRLRPHISEDYLYEVECLLNIRQLNLLQRLRFLMSHPFKRQSIKGDCSLLLSVVLNRL